MPHRTSRRCAVAALGAVTAIWTSPAPPLAAESALAPPAASSAPQASSDLDAPRDDVQAIALRLREGTKLADAPGRFRYNGDAITFIDAQNRELGALPNLNLERVARMLRTFEQPESVVWNVSGVITEYGGRNYLLLRRAVYKSAPSPPAPEIMAPAPAAAAPATSAPAQGPPPPEPAALHADAAGQ
ncbi:MAG: hypothetical protein IT424_01445 [Pirellulales bacterium]|nr:hypothetical protein [Pirellulales bacterium]